MGRQNWIRTVNGEDNEDKEEKSYNEGGCTGDDGNEVRNASGFQAPTGNVIEGLSYLRMP